jgi:hypothetical protein
MRRGRSSDRIVSKKVGRRVAIGLLFAFLIAFVGGATLQIAMQLFFRREHEPLPYASCREGLVALHGAVLRASHAAAGEADVDMALSRFREALQPEWQHVEGVRKTCAASEADEASLDALERLRYAEEHAVRREAGSLEVLRKQVAADLGDEAPPTGSISSEASRP